MTGRTGLERLGWECAAAQWLEIDRGRARLLRRIVEASPAPCRDEVLWNGRLSGDLQRPMSAPGIFSRMVLLRSALDDLGFRGAIMRVPGVGYQMTPAIAAAIDDLVMAHARVAA